MSKRSMDSYFYILYRYIIYIIYNGLKALGPKTANELQCKMHQFISKKQKLLVLNSSITTFTFLLQLALIFH